MEFLYARFGDGIDGAPPRDRETRDRETRDRETRDSETRDSET